MQKDVVKQVVDMAPDRLKAVDAPDKTEKHFKPEFIKKQCIIDNSLFCH